ncbi:hypothetical protein LVD15_08820 [Fulvivirga maritima]|uniref:hypothetical protein n=1 Tax=Fulvivirga maritima TaxID=2904247 RepID=UPI001F18587D|nr:hypothetical protein [Fulvivirga maritima]UII28517.1 hypothetical protein LVD15_08820 [Fulvivirga maritima]
MKNTGIIIIFLLLMLSTPSFSQNKLTLKDSLLLRYSENELRSMTSRELGNAVREMRGKPPAPLIVSSSKKSQTDNYGFNIIGDINSDSLEVLINRRVSDISKRNSEFNRMVFPNSYVDIINRFEYGFYKNLRTRELRHNDYHKLYYDFEGDEAFKLIAYTNNSRRTYFFDERDSLQKIVVETGHSVNEGRKYYWSMPMQYQKTTFYLWNGHLQYVDQLKLGEDVFEFSRLNDNWLFRSDYASCFGQTMPVISVYLCHFKSFVILVNINVSTYLFSKILL